MTFEKVDDAEIEGLLAHGLKAERVAANRSWIDWTKMDWARSLNLSAFLMNGIQFIAIYCDDRMFVQRIDNFVPCGYFRYQTIKTHVQS